MSPGDLVTLALELNAAVILTSQPGFIGESLSNYACGRLRYGQVCLVVAIHKQEVLLLNGDMMGWQAARYFVDATTPDA